MYHPSTSTSSPPNKSLNVFAQRLNNSAALCIEVGQYDRAIYSLQRALRLSEKHTNDMKSESQASSSTTSQCQECTLDDCIAFSEANRLSNSTDGRSNSSSLNTLTTDTIEPGSMGRHANKRRRIEKAELDSNKRNTNANADAFPVPFHANTSGTKDDDYYVYQRPIRVPRQGLEMGSVLFLIILFNLALAHHLKATAMSTVLNSNPSHSEGRANAIEKALMLYKLVKKYWFKLQQRLELNSEESNNTNAYSSIWFRMILQNNLGQIYKWTGNFSREEECLQDLLSIVFLVTDQTTVMPDRKRRRSGFQRDLEGFLTNTSVLTIHQRCCAEAA